MLSTALIYRETYKYLFLLLVFIYGNYSYSQIISFGNGDNKKYASFLLFEYNSEADEFYVVPCWSKYTNKKESLIHLSVSSEERNRWLRKLNNDDNSWQYGEVADKYVKGKKFEWVRAAENDEFAVILKYAPGYNVNFDERTPRFLNKYLSLSELEHFFIKNKNCRYRMALSNLEFNKYARFLTTIAYTDHETSTDGIMNIQFYDTISQKIVAAYKGYIKNNNPDGLGIFVKLRDDAVKIPWNESKFEYVPGIKLQYFIRTGVWHKGEFAEEENIRSFADTYAGNRNVIWAECLKDNLFPDLTGEHYFTTLYKIGGDDNPKFMQGNFKFKDFKYDDGSSVANSTGHSIGDKQTSGMSFAEQLLRVFSNAAEPYLYDNYTKVSEDIWRTYGFSNKQCLDNGYVINLTSEIKTIEISIRQSRIGPWRHIGTYGIIRSPENCYNEWEFGYYLRESEINSERFSFRNAAFQVLMGYVKKNYPSPQTDTSLTQEQINNINRFELIKSRAMLSNAFPPSPTDKLAGIWYDQERKLIYIIDTSKSVRIVSNTDENDSRTNITWKSDTYFELQQGNKNLGFQIRKIHPDRIEMEENVVWIRINSSAQ